MPNIDSHNIITTGTAPLSYDVFMPAIPNIAEIQACNGLVKLSHESPVSSPCIFEIMMSCEAAITLLDISKSKSVLNLTFKQK